MWPPGKEEDIHLGHAFARSCNATAHKGAKDAPQMPALLHGPRWTPFPFPASYPTVSTISRFRSDWESGTLSTIWSAFKKIRKYMPKIRGWKSSFCRRRIHFSISAFYTLRFNYSPRYFLDHSNKFRFTHLSKIIFLSVQEIRQAFLREASVLYYWCLRSQWTEVDFDIDSLLVDFLD